MTLSIKKKSMQHALAYLRTGHVLGGSSAAASVELAADAIEADRLGVALGHAYSAAERIRDALCELNLALGAHQEQLRANELRRAKRKRRKR